MTFEKPDLFSDHRVARDQLLQRITEMLEQDARVAAVWLIGSMGRERYDDLSDIDVWVVVTDENMDSWLAERERIMAELGKPLILRDVPANAPIGGAFMTALFQGPVGPLIEDWYWQPQSHARVPNDGRLLFDRGGLPVQFEAQTPTSQDRSADLTRKVRYFWAMLPIVAKKIYRSQEWDALSMMIMLRYVLHQVRTLAGVVLPSDQDKPPTSLLTQLEYLRGMANQMQTLESEITMLGGIVPSEAAVAACNFIDIVEAGIQK
jgi:predicted nucleotidyltransferase